MCPEMQLQQSVLDLLLMLNNTGFHFVPKHQLWKGPSRGDERGLPIAAYFLRDEVD